MEKIGRNLDKMVLIDTTEDEKNENLLLVHAWKGENSDARLA
jgi:hypothetical protein